MTERIAPLLRWAEGYYPSKPIEPPDIAGMSLALVGMFATAAFGEPPPYLLNLGTELNLPAVAGLRWHTRGSFVVAPPSRSGRRATQWIREPGEQPLPDALRLLEFLADACEEVRI